MERIRFLRDLHPAGRISVSSKIYWLTATWSSQIGGDLIPNEFLCSRLVSDTNMVLCTL